MSVLARHVALRVLLSAGLVLLAVTAVLTLVDLIDEARAVRAGGYSFADALLTILLTTPQRVYETLPVSVFIGSLLGLGQLAADGEMTALRSAGYGVWATARVLLATGLLLAMATILIGEGLAPAGNAAALERRQAAGAEPAAAAGLWLRKHGRYLHLQPDADRGRLRGVMAYELDAAGALRSSLYAARAEYDGAGWILRGVRESVLHDDGTVSSRSRDAQPGGLLPAAGVLALMLRPAEDLSAADLGRYLDYFAGEQLDLRTHRFAWWQRFATPLSCVVVLLLTVPFTATQARGGGLGQRVFVGILSGIAIYVFNRMSAHFGLLAGLPPWLAAFLPLFALLGLGAVALGARQRLRLRPGGWLGAWAQRRYAHQAGAA